MDWNMSNVSYISLEFVVLTYGYEAIPDGLEYVQRSLLRFIAARPFHLGSNIQFERWRGCRAVAR